jgi:acyl carrier protein
MSIELQIREYLIQNVLFSDNAFEFDNNDSFLEKGIIDSVAVMELVFFVEEQFNIAITDHEIIPDNFDSVNNLAHFIRSRQNNKG